MLFFDIETNGLLNDLTCIHCMVLSDGENTWEFRPNEVEKGVERLLGAVMNNEPICGHNIINFDIPALQKLFRWFEIPRSKRYLVVDTLVLSRLIYSDLKVWDGKLMRAGKLPGKLFESQSLKAWGYRLEELKGTYAEEMEDAWANFSEEMLAYNTQDVVVTKKLYEKVIAKNPSREAVELEHDLQWLMSQQERNGFPFDVKKALQLEVEIRAKAAVIDAKIRKAVPQIPDKIFIPKINNKTKGYIKGIPIQRYKDFNPNSRQQIEWLIKDKHHYIPENIELYDLEEYIEILKEKGMKVIEIEQHCCDYIKEGKARLKIDDETFKFIKDDLKAPLEVRNLAELFEESLLLSKRLGQLADGKNAWLKCIGTDGYIHGSVNPCGAITGRATHSRPNVAQVPKVGSPYGKECRELFGVPNGWYQVGMDAAGLELRCLAHFMAPYDGGVYADTVVNGDIHTLNQQAAGLPARNDAKTFIYAFLYGAGDAKIGKIVNGDNKDGKRLKREFLKKTPAIAQLKKAIEEVLVAQSDKGKIIKWKRKYLKGLDGRLLHVRSLHSALNLLLQSAGALICKKWIVNWEKRLIDRGFTHGWEGDFAFMAWVHDEAQIACKTKEIAKLVVEEGQEAMKDTERFFGFRVALDTEGKIGFNWSECH